MRVSALSLSVILAVLSVLPARAQSRSDTAIPHPFLSRTGPRGHVVAAPDQISALVAAEPGSAAEPFPTAQLKARASAAGTFSFRILPEYAPWVGVGKWVSLSVGAGLAGLGFALNNEADDAFRELDLMCFADPDACELAQDGSYADPALEASYQDILAKDRGARASLMGAQLSFAVSLILFVVDFQRSDEPEDVPYEPEGERSQVGLSVGPGELAVRFYFR